MKLDRNDPCSAEARKIQKMLSYACIAHACIASAIMAKLPAEIRKKLGRDYSKISAVVLTNLKLLGHSEVMGFHADEHVVYNENAKKKLPDGFKLYGDIANGQSILADIKTLFDK